MISIPPHLAQHPINKATTIYQFPHWSQLAVGMDINIRHRGLDIRKEGDGFIFTEHVGLAITMSGEETSSTVTAQVVAAEQKEGRLELGEESELSELESEAETSGKGEMNGKGTGRPEFNGAVKQQSTQDFFWHGNGNRSMYFPEDSDDDVCVTRGKHVIGEHSRAPSRWQRAAHRFSGGVATGRRWTMRGHGGRRTGKDCT